MFVKALSLQTKLKKHEYSKTVTNSHIYFQVSLVSESIDDPEPIHLPVSIPLFVRQQITQPLFVKHFH